MKNNYNNHINETKNVENTASTIYKDSTIRKENLENTENTENTEVGIKGYRWKSVWRNLVQWYRKRQAIRANGAILARMSDTQLRDIGLTRKEVRKDETSSFWRRY